LAGVICFKLVPQGIEKCINREKASLRELVEEVGDYLEDNYIVVVNGRIVENPEYVVTSGDVVVFVSEFMGG
jgi:molybdopterin converting factor small subunit